MTASGVAFSGAAVDAGTNGTLLAGPDGVTAGAGAAMGESPTTAGAVASTPLKPSPTGAELPATSDPTAGTESEAEKVLASVVSLTGEALSADPPCVASELSPGGFSTTRSTGPVGRMA